MHSRRVIAISDDRRGRAVAETNRHLMIQAGRTLDFLVETNLACGASWLRVYNSKEDLLVNMMAKARYASLSDSRCRGGHSCNPGGFATRQTYNIAVIVRLVIVIHRSSMSVCRVKDDRAIYTWGAAFR
jgi:hypothetical protein